MLHRRWMLVWLRSLSADVSGLRAADMDAHPALRFMASEVVWITVLLLAFLVDIRDDPPVRPDEAEPAASAVLVLES